MTADLGRRAVACKRWRWMAGMLDEDGNRYAWNHLDREVMYPYNHDGSFRWGYDPSAPPDLTDPATLGCLLALVREAWGDPSICTAARPIAGGRYAWWTTGKSNTEEHHTEAEALVAALEAAP